MSGVGVGTMVFQSDLGYEVDLAALHVANPFNADERCGTQYNSEVTPRLTCRFRGTSAILNVYSSGMLNILGTDGLYY